MINFLSLEFLLGIIVGCLVVMAIYQLTKRNNDNSSLETKITAIQTLLGNLKTENKPVFRSNLKSQISHGCLLIIIRLRSYTHQCFTARM